MKRINVNKNGLVKTLGEAFKLLDPLDENEIYLTKGIYYEKNKLTYNNVTIIGEDKDNTIIVYDDYAKKVHQDGLEYNTFRTYTLMILANNVKLENITIMNQAGFGENIGQAVALALIGDQISIDNCRILAHQDTLFLGPLPKDLLIRYINFLPNDELIYPKEHRIFINNTFIQGDVDFIFGCGNAFFNHCEFNSLERSGYVFAPSTEKDEDGGFIVENSIFTSVNQLPHVYLARPWRDYGKVELNSCLMDNHIYDAGFINWQNTLREKTCRFIENNSIYFDKHSFQRVWFVNREKIKTYTKDI